MKSRIVILIASSLLAGGCTATKAQLNSVQQAAQPVRLDGARIAVFPFRDAPGQPDTGAHARDLTEGILAAQRGATIVSPSLVAAYLRDHSVVPSESDLPTVETAARALGADVVVWGAVNQFTPYRWDRLMPATPPYVEISVQGFRVGAAGVARGTARKQGSVPATVWARQPTFDDVASEALTAIIAAFK